MRENRRFFLQDISVDPKEVPKVGFHIYGENAEKLFGHKAEDFCAERVMNATAVEHAYSYNWKVKLDLIKSRVMNIEKL